MSGFEIHGLKELQRELNAMQEDIAKKAAQQGAVKGVAHLRTQTRRAASISGVGSFFNSEVPIRMLITSKRLKRPVRRADGNSGWGARVRANNALKVWEKGRKPYTKRSGVPHAGSPQMRRYAFWFETLAQQDLKAREIMIQHTRAVLRRKWARLARRSRLMR